MLLMPKRKISELVGFGRVPDSTLAQLLESLRANPALLETEPPSRFAMYRESKALFKEIGTTLRVDDFEWSLAEPSRLLRHFCEASQTFGNMMQQAIEKRGVDVPLNLIIYSDEVTPGNPLAPQNRRQFTNFYIGVLEFGGAALQSEHFWLTIATLRTSIAKEMVGKASRVLKAILHLWLVDNELHNGIFINLPRGRTKVKFRMSNALSDESALKHGLDVKGAAGLLPCIVCANVVKQGRGLDENDDSRLLVPLHNHDYEKLIFRTDDDLWRAFDELRAKRPPAMSKTRFQTEETLAGVNCNIHGVLADLELRAHYFPVAMNTYDVTHVLYSNGICNLELQLVLKELAGLGVHPTMYGEWLKSALQWPAFTRDRGMSLHKTFSPRGWREKDKMLKASAVEVVMAVPTLRHFIEVVFPDMPAKMSAHFESLSLLANFCALVQAAKFSKNPRRFVVDMQRTYSAYMAAAVRAHGERKILPKHHMGMHLPLQVQRDNCVLDAITLERKHFGLKQVAEHLQNTMAFERTTLSRAIRGQLRVLQTASLDDGLKGRSLEAGDMTLADKVRWNGMTFVKGDVMQRASGEICFVEAGAAHLSGLGAIVTKLCVHDRYDNYCVGIRDGTFQLTRFLDGDRHAICWYEDGASSVVIIR